MVKRSAAYPDSVGLMDPDTGRQKWHKKLKKYNISWRSTKRYRYRMACNMYCRLFKRKFKLFFILKNLRILSRFNGTGCARCCLLKRGLLLIWCVCCRWSRYPRSRTTSATGRRGSGSPVRAPTSGYSGTLTFLFTSHILAMS
jgi:hypothetical protein